MVVVVATMMGLAAGLAPGLVIVDDPAAGAQTVRPALTLPPATLPAVTLPPLTLPPVSLPPVTVPPVTVPPVTLPAVTLPPVTLPPVTTPPVTSPPATVPAGASPSTTPPLVSGASALAGPSGPNTAGPNRAGSVGPTSRSSGGGSAGRARRVPGSSTRATVGNAAPPTAVRASSFPAAVMSTVGGFAPAIGFACLIGGFLCADAVFDRRDPKLARSPLDGDDDSLPFV
ncbi:MAG: hypothetical protein JOZ99_16015 [Actinobacteria bacterium]|nr:hypothetical protein [Actinomycetota bacterium]